MHYKIKEGNKERIQNYRGVVLQRRGHGQNETFTVRKMSSGVGVERIFPVNSPFIEEVEINKRGRVRRAKLFYLRELKGKAARIARRKGKTERKTERRKLAYAEKKNNSGSKW